MENKGRHFKQSGESGAPPQNVNPHAHGAQRPVHFAQQGGPQPSPRHAISQHGGQQVYQQGTQRDVQQGRLQGVPQMQSSADAPQGAQRPVRHPAAVPPRTLAPVSTASRANTASNRGTHSGSASQYAQSPYAASRNGYSAASTSAKSAKSARDYVSYALIAVGVILLLVAGGLFVHAQLGYKQASDFYGNLNKEVLKVDDTGGAGIPNIDFAALKEVNEDVVGWIYIPGTNVNYVVAQGDSNDTYLRKLISGEYNANGTVFMDVDGAEPGLVDQQTTLYGHHMNDGSMFSQIYESLDQKKFDTIERVYYITPETTYELKPLFTMRVADDYTAARQTNFEGEGGLAQYLSDSLKHAEAKAGDAEAELRDATKVLTLVTCDDAFLAQTKRAAMVCTLVGEFGAPAQGAPEQETPEQPAPEQAEG